MAVEYSYPYFQPQPARHEFLPQFYGLQAMQSFLVVRRPSDLPRHSATPHTRKKGATAQRKNLGYLSQYKQRSNVPWFSNLTWVNYNRGKRSSVNTA